MALYYAVHFDDNTYDVKTKSEIIFDGEDLPVVGQTVQLIYGSKLFEAEICFISGKT